MPTTEPPMADPGVTLELMTPQQKEVFLLKEHARILIAAGLMTVPEALERHLISDADAAQLRLSQDLTQPMAVLQAPAEPPVRVERRCC